MRVSGFVASGYEQVRDVFARRVDDGRESGASVSVWVGGEEVVGLSGGWADSGRRRPWRSDTLVHTYSTSKPFASLTALIAVAEGRLLSTIRWPPSGRSSPPAARTPSHCGRS
jgi:CubicO group peptidase (beta-lactamase class C family)